jgi:hypothetical protein
MQPNTRTINAHHTNEANRAITIVADACDPKNGNASHIYDLTWHEQDDSDMHIAVEFQHGPIGEVGVNGITNEVLLVIVADRLRCFQASEYRCNQNALALRSVETALNWLEKRTREREARGVEGTHEV